MITAAASKYTATPPMRDGTRPGTDLRRHGGDHAVDEGRAGAQADQRPHVRAAVDDRLAPRTKNGQPAHSTTGQRQHQLDPALRAMSNQPAAVAEHGQHGDDHRQRQRPPEAALKSTQLRVLVVVQARQHRLQRHAALRAVAGMVLADLRVHRAGVDRMCEATAHDELEPFHRWNVKRRHAVCLKPFGCGHGIAGPPLRRDL
jgi:hypothetical protein